MPEFKTGNIIIASAVISKLWIVFEMIMGLVGAKFLLSMAHTVWANLDLKLYQDNLNLITSDESKIWPIHKKT